MSLSTRMALRIKEIKALADRFTPEQIEGCISEQMETGRNVCLMNSTNEKIIDELAKAEYVRDLMDRGVALPDALRQLAQQMRRLQTGYDGKPEERGRT